MGTRVSYTAKKSIQKRLIALLVVCSLVMSLFVTAMADEGGESENYEPDETVSDEVEEDASEDEEEPPAEDASEEDEEPEEDEDEDSDTEQPSTEEEDGDEDGESEDSESEDGGPEDQDGQQSGSESDSEEATEDREEEQPAEDGDEGSILDVLKFEYDPQPESAEEVAALVEEFDGDFDALPKWKEMLPQDWLPTGWAQSQFEDEETGAAYWRLAPGIMAMGMPFAMPMTFADLQADIAAASSGEVIEIPNDVVFDDVITIQSGKSITIKPKVSTVTLTMDDGQDLVRHFIVETGAELTIEDMVLDGNEIGGGIHNVGTLKVKDGVVIQNCQANYGGGIYSVGTATVENSKIRGNTAVTGGGGVCGFHGILAIENSEITDNKVTAAFAYGGGVYNSGGTLEIKGGEISRNYTDGFSGGRGGGVYNSGTAIMSAGEITGNIATQYGSGVYNQSGTFTLDGGKINSNGDNNNADGGGVYNMAAFIMEDGEINGNAAKHGGGVYQHDNNAVFTLENGEINGNAARTGNGVYNQQGSFMMKGGKINGNKPIVANGLTLGGGVHLVYGTFTMEDGEISGNTAVGLMAMGGGVYIQEGTFTMINGKISGNSSEVSGGGVYNQDGTFNMKGGEISGNTSASWSGGVHNVKIFTMEGGKISENTANLGGGIFNSGSAATIMMEDGEVSGNIATRGSGVYNEGGTITIKDGKINNNGAADSATYTAGGGMYMSSGTILMEGGEINGNRVSGDYASGGGIYRQGGSLTIQGGKISNNNAAYQGGGIFTYGSDLSGSFTMTGGEISGNTAEEGGGIYGDRSNAINIQDSTISGNTATSDGGGIFAQSLEDITLNNVVFSSNSAAIAFGGTLSDARRAIHNAQITNTTYTQGSYAYNNLDICFVPVINFEPNGGSLLSDASLEVRLGSLVREPKVVSPDSYTALSGWYTEAAGGAQWDFSSTTVTNDTTLYARWAPVYTVTFNANGGNPEPIPQKIKENDFAVEPIQEPTREHFAFGGWYHITTKWDFEKHPVDKDIELVAWWTPVPYTFGYDENGGKTNNKLPSDATYFYGNEVTVTPIKVERDGHTFLGWSKDPNATTAQYSRGDVLKIEDNTILYAVWEQEIYELTYHANGGENPPDPETDLVYNDKVKVSGREDMTRDGHTFLGWSKNAEATTADVRPGSTITMKEDITLYAVWRNNAGYPITVEHYQYEEGGFANAVLVGEDTQVVMVQYDESFTATPNSYAGYIFMAAQSDPTTVTAVTSAQTMKLYYMKADGYQIIFEGILDGDNRAELEVLDRRDAAATPVDWNSFLAILQPKLYFDGTEVTGTTITYTSSNYSQVNFRELTRENPHAITVLASWDNGRASATGGLLLDIVDTTPPEITVKNTSVTVTAGQAPKDAGYLIALAGVEISDNYDESVAIQYDFLDKTFDTIDWNSAGQQYAMYIDATDSSGNKAVRREVVTIHVAASGSGNGSGGNGGSGNGNSSGGSDIRDNLDGGYVVLDDDGVPLGFYVQDENGNWTYIDAEDVPLGTLPRTGDGRAIGVAFVSMLFACAAFPLCRKRKTSR